MAEVYELLIHCVSQGDITQLDSVLTNHRDALDINFQTEGGLNLLMQAVISAGSNVYPKGRYLDVVKVLIQAGVSLAVADTSYGRTALHWTVYYDKEDILTELLIDDSEDLCRIPDFSGLSPFHLAIQSNSIKCLEVFLAQLPADILEYPDTQGRKPLTLSIMEGNLEAFVLLLNAGVNLIDVDTSPLYLSAQCGQIEMLELLLKTGQVDAGEINNDGQTIAHISAAQSSAEMLQVVARYRAELLQSPDARGITPLMYACGYGIDTNVKFLIKKKVPLDSVDNDGKSSMHWASESQADKAPKCIQLLCKALPSLIELTDQQGRPPFHIAAMNGSSKNMDVLVNLGCNVQAIDANQCTALHWAAASGQLECIATSVKLGILVDVPNDQGVLPIHFAANSGNEHCVKYLLEARCDIESKDNNQRTPLHWAVQDFRSIKCLETLIMHGANFNEIDGEGLNALHMACRSDNLPACQYLIETVKCNGNAADAEGQTALFYALEGGSLGCMDFLLSRGSNSNHQNNEGRSLAHLAASIGLLEALLLLAQYGADFELQTPKGIKPIHDAAANGQADALECLASIGCDIFAQTLDGSTILHYSAVQGHSICVKMILDFNFDPNVVLTTEEGDKLTPLDCAEAYGHTETAAIIKNAGGQHYRSFALTNDDDIPTTEDKPSEAVEVFADEKSPVDQQKFPPDAQSNEACDQQYVTANVSDGEVLPVENFPQYSSEHDVKPPSSEALNNENELVDKPVDNDDSRVVASQLADANTAELKTTTGKIEIVQDQNSQIGTDSNLLERKPSNVKSSSSLFAKAISFLKREDKKPSVVSSSVALYGAQATVLAGAIIGSPLGKKAMEIGEKVAKNAAEDLKEEAARFQRTLPALLWDESTSPTPLPTPTPTPPATPSPEPVKPPSPVVVNIDPYERRIKKARAQLDKMKTPAFLAIQELLKAEETHVKLTKQFEFARLEEHLNALRAEHRMNEIKAEQETQALLEKQNQKIETVQATSEVIHSKIDRVLETAAKQNSILHCTLRTMGVPPNPTVSEWIKQKEEQKKAKLQNYLISWDIHKSKREEAIKMKQLLTSDRATRHAAWETEKNIQKKINYIKDKKIGKNTNPYIHHNTMHFHSPPSTGEVKKHIRRATDSSESKKDKKLRPNSMRRSCSVQFTPTGFRTVRLESNSSTPHKTSQLWKLGDSVAKGNLSNTKELLDEVPLSVRTRATGPKTYHVGRSLLFVPPDQYKRSQKDTLQLQAKLLNQDIVLHNNHTAQYHSHTRDVFIK